MSHDGFKCIKCGYFSPEYGIAVCPKCGFSILDDEAKPFCAHRFLGHDLRCVLCDRILDGLKRKGD